MLLFCVIVCLTCCFVLDVSCVWVIGFVIVVYCLVGLFWLLCSGWVGFSMLVHLLLCLLGGGISYLFSYVYYRVFVCFGLVYDCFVLMIVGWWFYVCYCCGWVRGLDLWWVGWVWLIMDGVVVSRFFTFLFFTLFYYQVLIVGVFVFFCWLCLFFGWGCFGCLFCLCWRDVCCF